MMDIFNAILEGELMQCSELAGHIRTLRRGYFKENQSAFASRLGLTTVSVARYETNRIPKRDVLENLLGLAERVGYADGAIAFSRALGPRWLIDLATGGELKAIHDDTLFDVVMKAYGNWRALQDQSEKEGA